MAPRRLRDRLDRFVLPLPFSLRFWIVFVFVLDPFWVGCPNEPWGWGKTTRGAPVGELFGTLVVLKRFFWDLAVWGRFVDPLGPLLGSFGGAPGSFWGALGAVRRQNKSVFHLPYFVLGCSWSLECSLGAVLGQDETLFSSSLVPACPLSYCPSTVCFLVS